MNFKHSHYLNQNKMGCYIFNLFTELWMAGFVPGTEDTAGAKWGQGEDPVTNLTEPEV